MISNFSLKKRDIDISYSSNSTFSYDKEKILRTFQNPALFLSSTFFLVFVIISVLSWFDFVFETYFLNKSNLLSSFKNVHELCYLHRYTEVRPLFCHFLISFCMILGFWATSEESSLHVIFLIRAYRPILIYVFFLILRAEFGLLGCWKNAWKCGFFILISW